MKNTVLIFQLYFNYILIRPSIFRNCFFIDTLRSRLNS